MLKGNSYVVFEGPSHNLSVTHVGDVCQLRFAKGRAERVASPGRVSIHLCASLCFSCLTDFDFNGTRCFSGLFCRQGCGGGTGFLWVRGAAEDNAGSDPNPLRGSRTRDRNGARVSGAA